MSKTILQVFKKVKQAFKKVNWEGVASWTPIVIFFATITYGFSGIIFRNDKPYKMWEVAAVYSTLVYTLVILITGLLTSKFKGVNYKQGMIITALLALIVYFALSNLQEKLGFLDVSLCRAGTMLLYLLISMCYVTIDAILITARIPEKDEIINSVLYCDGPTCIIFSVLLLFAFISGFQKTNELNDTFFSGAIAFQMILASIVWGIIDNSERIKKCKLMKKLTGG